MADVYKTIDALLRERGISGAKMSSDLGMSRSFMTELRKGRAKSIKADTAQKIADYFGVTTDYLLGTETEKAPTLTEKDRRDVAKDVERIMDDLENSGDLMFDGAPMSPEAKAAMASAMRIGLEEAKRRNKETYTPKKFRKE